ncbi:hypothetical protein F4809DRAFT_659399 [Biscogniauxia mediterranea]|nr:hypothetical protein F4809DRAFT_659399 [Biscogniauxia mediterranea]
MPSYNSPVTCLSSEDHKDDIKDHMLHYLGCLEFSKRDGFFEDSNPLWEQEIEHLVALGSNYSDAKQLVAEKILSWKTNCESELRRIDFLRKTLSTDETDKHLVHQLENSKSDWMKSKAFPDKIEKGVSQPGIENKDYGEYEPEKDVTVPIMQFEDGKGVDIKGDARIWGKFPNQKTTLAKLFHGEPELNLEDSLLHKDNYSRDDGSDPIRYFHIPANNMMWAEQAISRYFGNKIPDHDGTHRELKRLEKTKAYMMLRGPYWRNQLYGHDGPSTPPHARHMRPLCTTVSTSTDRPDYFPKNVALFMPYLHWDTSRRREQFAVEIEDIMEKAEERSAQLEEEDREKRKAKRHNILDDASRPSTPTSSASNRSLNKTPTWLDRIKRLFGSEKRIKLEAQMPMPQPGDKKAKIGSMRSLLREMHLIDPKPKVDARGRVEVQSLLGRYLLDAARLYEGMTTYRDKKLLRKYLTSNPPMHPRRTLDQAFYWTLKSTRQRDMDQVVYRGTTALPKDFHTYDRERSQWPEHEDFGIEGPCGECKANIQKVSRVIMVDQLWMWILDEKTIITCFPKRYGANKHDHSGVHKAIRLRLQDNGPDQIRSVFDLALIIIDECSNMFFDRTKTTGKQPQVIDTFSKAIADIMHKQTTAFERLWRWTDEAGDIYRSKTDGDTSDLHVPLLDINPEGQLEREIKDIIEELDIMLNITKTHRDILKAFIGNAEHILDPFGSYGRNGKRAMTSQNFWKKSQVGGGGSGERDGGASEEDPKRRDDYHWFRINADERYDNVVERIRELEELRASATSTAESVKDLLELKQQQAGVVQAWQSVKQSEETIKQGRSIMMFTLVTIVFLPLSFLSSIFGMNNVEFSDNLWTIKDQLRLMFPISAGVIFLSLLFAFSGWTRAWIWYAYTWAGTTALVRTGAYDLWLDGGARGAEGVRRAAADYAGRLKAQRREQRFERRRRAAVPPPSLGEEYEDEDEDGGRRRSSGSATATMMTTEEEEKKSGSRPGSRGKLCCSPVGTMGSSDGGQVSRDGSREALRPGGSNSSSSGTVSSWSQRLVLSLLADHRRTQSREDRRDIETGDANGIQ